MHTGDCGYGGRSVLGQDSKVNSWHLNWEVSNEDKYKILNYTTHIEFKIEFNH